MDNRIKRFNEDVSVPPSEINPDIDDKDFILTEVKKMLDKQENDVVEYMNKYMTQDERNRHGDNIWGFLVKSDALISIIELKMMAKGK